MKKLWSSLIPALSLLFGLAFSFTASAQTITQIIDATGDGAGNTLDFARSIGVDGSGNVYVSGAGSNNAFKIAPALSPEEAAEALIELIGGLGIHHGTANSLTSKLHNAIASLQCGNTHAAVNQLNAFVNQVEAQRGKKLTEEQADMLIAEAQGIIDAIEAGSFAKRSSETAETTPTSVPAAYQLDQNYPNPFNPSNRFALRYRKPRA